MKPQVDQIWICDPFSTMAAERQQYWLDNMHVRSNIDDLFADPLRSVVVLTQPGCGLTTSLALLRSHKLLTFSYNPDQWPGQPETLIQSNDHFEHWMAHIAHVLTEEFRQSPETLQRCQPEEHQFLVWLMSRYVHKRQGDEWLRFIERHSPAAQSGEVRNLIESSPIEYSDTVSDIYGQIHECLALAEHLGYEGIYAAIDISIEDWITRRKEQRDELAAAIKQLLSRLTPLQRPRFGIKMGVPEYLLAYADAAALIRGRAMVDRYAWDNTTLERMVEGFVRMATTGPEDAKDSEYAAYWQALMPDIKAIWAEAGPAAAVGVAAGIAQSLSQGAAIRPDLTTVRRYLYRSSAPLRLDPDPHRQTVWRGTTPIALTEAPFALFRALWRARGGNTSATKLGSTAESIDQTLKRLRDALEPAANELLQQSPRSQRVCLYVQRTRLGIYLESDLCRFS